MPAAEGGLPSLRPAMPGAIQRASVRASAIAAKYAGLISYAPFCSTVLGSRVRTIRKASSGMLIA